MVGLLASTPVHYCPSLKAKPLHSGFRSFDANMSPRKQAGPYWQVPEILKPIVVHIVLFRYCMLRREVPHKLPAYILKTL